MGCRDWDNGHGSSCGSQQQSHRAFWQSLHLAVGRRENCGHLTWILPDVIMKSQKGFGPHSHEKGARSSYWGPAPPTQAPYCWQLSSPWGGQSLLN